MTTHNRPLTQAGIPAPSHHEPVSAPHTHAGRQPTHQGALLPQAEEHDHQEHQEEEIGLKLGRTIAALAYGDARTSAGSNTRAQQPAHCDPSTRPVEAGTTAARQETRP